MPLGISSLFKIQEKLHARIRPENPRTFERWREQLDLRQGLFFGKVGAMSPPPKVPNADRRSREHLTPTEIDR